MKARRPTIVAALLAVLAASCTVGLNYHPPVQDIPARWSEAPQNIAPSARSQTEWWKTFNDPELDSLIDRAMRANLGLQLAEARVREARARRVMVAAPLWPSVSTTGSYTRRWEDEDLFGPLSAGGQPVLLGAQAGESFPSGIRCELGTRPVRRYKTIDRGGARRP